MRTVAPGFKRLWCTERKKHVGTDDEAERRIQLTNNGTTSLVRILLRQTPHAGMYHKSAKASGIFIINYT